MAADTATTLPELVVALASCDRCDVGHNAGSLESRLGRSGSMNRLVVR